MDKTLVGAYVRVSRDSEYSESDSLKNQLLLIEDFCKENDLLITKKYIDDGYTGTNFNRPGFNELLFDLGNKNINCVIVKDLSRFGRDLGWIQIYLNETLPELGVRFISINDNIDSKNNNNFADELNFKLISLIYEHYAIDGSNKVRQLKHHQQLSGEYIGVSAPYGYLKDPKDNHKIIIDKYASKIVKRIFKMTLELKSKNEIVDILNKEEIYPPSKYKAEVIKVTSETTKISNKWTTEMIRQILNNQVYIGNMVQGKISKPRRKSDKRVKNKQEDWIIVKNTHQSIISKEDFETVQNILKCSKAVLEGNDILLKYLKCHECGNSFYRNNSKGNIYYYCYGYRKRNCSSHSINKNILEKIVLEKIQEKDSKIKGLNDKNLSKYVECIYVYERGKLNIEFKKE